jgi:hypothetical protein
MNEERSFGTSLETYLFLVSLLGFAGNLSGWLVDPNCFASLSSFRSTPESSWDVNSAIRYCSAEKKTHSFAVVQQDDHPSILILPEMKRRWTFA